MHYFFSWSAETYRRQICDDLRGKSDSIVIRDSTSVDRLVKAFEGARLIPRTEFDGIDVRICCQYRNLADSVIHELSFEYPPLMAVDGRVYEREPQLFELVVSFLPTGYVNN